MAAKKRDGKPVVIAERDGRSLMVTNIQWSPAPGMQVPSRITLQRSDCDLPGVDYVLAARSDLDTKEVHRLQEKVDGMRPIVDGALLAQATRDQRIRDLEFQLGQARAERKEARMELKLANEKLAKIADLASRDGDNFEVCDCCGGKHQ